MARLRSLFDIVGPVMIGPSSSHTAGAVRLGRLARAVLGSTPKTARIGLHGSFATTGRGHGTDLALTAGLLGFSPDDPRIRDASRLAINAGLDVEFTETDLGQVHPNSVCIELEAADGSRLSIHGSSIGGGDVVITRIDEFDIELTGELPSLVVEHADRRGVIAAVTNVLAEDGVNIAALNDARERRGERALMVVQTDEQVSPATVERVLGVQWVRSVRAVPKV